MPSLTVIFPVKPEWDWLTLHYKCYLTWHVYTFCVSLILYTHLTCQIKIKFDFGIIFVNFIPTNTKQLNKIEGWSRDGRVKSTQTRFVGHPLYIPMLTFLDYHALNLFACGVHYWLFLHPSKSNVIIPINLVLTLPFLFHPSISFNWPFFIALSVIR